MIAILSLSFFMNGRGGELFSEEEVGKRDENEMGGLGSFCVESFLCGGE